MKEVIKKFIRSLSPPLSPGCNQSGQEIDGYHLILSNNELREAEEMTVGESHATGHLMSSSGTCMGRHRYIHAYISTCTYVHMHTWTYIHSARTDVHMHTWTHMHT